MAARLGLLSDTHLPKGDYSIPDSLLRAFEGVEAILHGGDVVDLACLDPLTEIAPIYVVAGNNDPPSVGERCGWRRALRWRGWRIGLVHGDQPPGRSTPERARNAFRRVPPGWETIPTTEPVPRAWPVTQAPSGRPIMASLEVPGTGPLDCIVFGHSHQPFCSVSDGILMINPGSPTERRREPKASFALLQASDDGRLEARMVYL